MVSSGSTGRQRGGAPDPSSGQLPLEHYLRIILHRKWLALAVWAVVSAATAIIAYTLPDIYTSETLILVDPQKVPEAYVKATVTGDIRNRLGTLSQQILSTSRLQNIIESNNLYPEERKKMAREDVIAHMRSDISVRVVSDFGASMDLQAFRIVYSGKDPRLVAAVTSQIAQLFINKNLEARQQQATGTAEFLGSQLAETRRQLEAQESKLRDFQLKHIGEMPKQESANIQMLGQAQAQLQIESEALARAEQQKSLIQSMMGQTSPVVDLDTGDEKGIKTADALPGVTPSMRDKAKLAALRSRYTDNHPDMQKLKSQIEQEEAEEAQKAIVPAQPPAPQTAKVVRRAPASHFNPVLQAQLAAVEADITKHKEEHDRLAKLASVYRAKLDAIPVREQEIAELERDYEMSKTHYSQLLEKQLSAKTATELEMRSKGEQFTVLDPALPAERPTQPNRPLINTAGSIGGLVLGLLLAIGKDFFGMSIIVPQDVTAATGIPVLEEIPVIQTYQDRRIRKRWIWAASTSMAMAALGGGVFLFLRY